MLKVAISQLKIALILLILLTVLTGLLYPLAVTAVTQLFFPWQANGSLINQNGKVLGSVLIGQSFTEPKYFWGRPSATSPFPYNGEASSGSNLGPSNADFLTAVKDRVVSLKSGTNQWIPVDLVTASGSGLDPEISPLAVFYQVPRIAKMRHVSEKDLQGFVQNYIQNRTLGILGEPRVNILELNLALDRYYPVNKGNNNR